MRFGVRYTSHLLKTGREPRSKSAFACAPCSCAPAGFGCGFVDAETTSPSPTSRSAHGDRPPPIRNAFVSTPTSEQMAAFAVGSQMHPQIAPGPLPLGLCRHRSQTCYRPASVLEIASTRSSSMTAARQSSSAPGRFAKCYLGEERWLESKTAVRRPIAIKRSSAA